jgi:hypothetical protein
MRDKSLYLTPHNFSDEMRVRWYDDDDGHEHLKKRPYRSTYSS